METKHNYTIDFLRGIAAMSVALFHFTNGNPNYLLAGNILKEIGRYGNLGVEVFFVISGYIIPYSMMRNKYSIKNYGKFFYKRLIRIEPPYIITVALVILLNYISTLSPYYRGQPFVLNFETIKVIFSHLGYLTELLGYKWLTPVFWTLSIEFQYYILIGLVFGLLVNNKLSVRIASILALFILSFSFSDTRLLFHYLLLFTPGIICFLYKGGKISVRWAWALLALNIILGVYNYGIVAIIACTLTFLLIYRVELAKNSICSFLGNISFSLYLIHVPVCMRILNLSENFLKNSFYRSAFIIMLLGIAIIVSYLFYRFVEKPFLSLSKRVSY